MFPVLSRMAVTILMFAAILTNVFFISFAVSLLRNQQIHIKSTSNRVIGVSTPSWNNDQ